MSLKTWMTDKKIIKKANVTALASLVFTLVEVTANAVLDLKMSPMYSGCMNEMNQSFNSFIPLILNVIPVITLILITAFYDMKSLQYVREFRRTRPTTSNEERTLLQETPFRSTIINLMCIFLVLIFSSVMPHKDINAEASWPKMISITCLVLMLKNLIVLWTFRVYQANMHINQNEERERKRQIEIKEAQKRKRERREKRNSPPTEVFEMSERRQDFLGVSANSCQRSQRGLPEIEC